MVKEYQILSKNSCLFLKAENENIINNAKIESYSYSRNYNKNSDYEVDERNMFSIYDNDFFGGSGNKNENYDKYENNNCIPREISYKYQFLQKYILKKRWYDDKSKEFCEKCNLGVRARATRDHVINECSFYSKWREESLDKIKQLYKINELLLEIDNKNLEQLINNLLNILNNLDESKHNNIYEVLDFIISGFKNV